MKQNYFTSFKAEKYWRTKSKKKWVGGGMDEQQIERNDGARSVPL
jgi:hypothetical protein